MQTDIEELINQVRLLFNALVQAGEQIHAGRGVTMAQRAVLEFLYRNGPATVPDIARRRRVSRQHIQTLVNPLLASGAVESIDNPAHKRSRLIGLTQAGRRTIGQMQAREREVLEEHALTVSAGQLRQAAEVLRSVRHSIETLH